MAVEALCLRSDQEVIEHHRFTYNIPNAPIEASGKPSNKDYERPAAHEQAHALSKAFWLPRCFIASDTEAPYESVHTQMNMLSFARHQTKEQPSNVPRCKHNRAENTELCQRSLSSEGGRGWRWRHRVCGPIRRL